MDPEYRRWVYHFSLVYGFATAGGFLLLALLVKLVYFLTETYGCCLCCCCCENRLPPKARKIKNALDSIEAYKQQQLDKLKESYAQQSDWIRQNCAAQMERVRDNYHGQIQNIKDIRQYGSTQLQSVRDQYFEQMQRIRDYSLAQLDRAQENYITQRQRLRKFSAQNYLRMRATGKYTQRTLNKVIENLSPLYLDLTNCRQGLGGRQESIHFPEFNIIEELEPFRHDDRIQHGGVFEQSSSSVENSNHSSAYFTPASSRTPVREVQEDCRQRKASSLKSSPTRDVAENVSEQGVCKHKKSKSFSHFLPRGLLAGSGADGESKNMRYLQTKASQKNSNASSALRHCQGNEQTVTAIVERVTTSSDYLDVETPKRVSHSVERCVAPDLTKVDILHVDEDDKQEPLSVDDHAFKRL